MTRRADLLMFWCIAGGAAMLLLAGCEINSEGRFTVIPGPSVPSALPTAVPFVWDAREELDVWVNNAVTHGPVPMSVVGDGADAFIRLELRRGVEGFVIRGPDLDPPAKAARGLAIWYRWRLDPTLSPTASRTFSIHAIFEVLIAPRPPDQPRDVETLQPVTDWTRVVFSAFGSPLDVKYVYFQQFSNNPGVFEIDRIELVF